MIEISASGDVQPAEYLRLLGYPRGRELEGRAAELAEWARDWYEQHGKPMVWAREADCLEMPNGSVRINGVQFTSSRLRSTLDRAEAHSALLVAVSAGPELEREAQQLWCEEKPDEYFFLEIYGSAVVEHLTTTVGARLCAWAEDRGMAVLPHYSPGYPEWDIAEQSRLLDLMKPLPFALDVMDSGMLRPKKSLLAVFGMTRHVDRVSRLTELVPCTNCSYHPCQFRRAPYLRAPDSSGLEVLSQAPAALDANPRYTVNARALKRWAAERLTLRCHADGIDALFRYDGTTCTNMGRPLAFEYHLKLGPREDGYPIREQSCEPAAGDTGHMQMCRYIANGRQLLDVIAAEKPLLGRPLNDALAWQRANSAAGCYCEPASREHKWGLVLETIHFALAQQENNRHGN